jgi:hypothetical protein
MILEVVDLHYETSRGLPASTSLPLGRNHTELRDDAPRDWILPSKGLYRKLSLSGAKVTWHVHSDLPDSEQDKTSYQKSMSSQKPSQLLRRKLYRLRSSR